MGTQTHLVSVFGGFPHVCDIFMVVRNILDLPFIIKHYITGRFAVFDLCYKCIVTTISSTSITEFLYKNFDKTWADKKTMISEVIKPYYYVGVYLHGLLWLDGSLSTVPIYFSGRTFTKDMLPFGRLLMRIAIGRLGVDGSYNKKTKTDSK